MSTSPQWEERLHALWQEANSMSEALFLQRVRELVGELPEGTPDGLLELAGAYDWAGQEEQAAPLYRQALAAGLPGPKRRQANIQLASTLRNLGQAQAALDLLRQEAASGHDELDGAIAAFSALALLDLGRFREAAATALGALAGYVPRYNNAIANYARALGDSPDADDRAGTDQRTLLSASGVTGSAPQGPVRLAEPSDSAVIGQFLHDFNQEFNEETPDATALAARTSALMASGQTSVLLGGEPPAGLAVLRFRPAIWSDGFECYLAELYVVPDSRGRGLGRAIMQASMAYARQRGADTMNIEVDEPDVAARSLYESLGFSNRDGGDGPLMFVYERDLH